ncbi:MAG TPA: 30S ribosomal protein S4 [Spirochaetota bacterium]|nr:30S ribosomal protein S4 [Spirochaetota bacterium]
MARYTEPVCRLCRREKVKLFLKGDRCNTKCPIDKKKFGPGMPVRRRKNLSEFGIQLREKQKVRWYYGLQEKQFKIAYKKAEKAAGATGTNLLIMLERRLDNVVFRMGFAESRAHARQLVRHSNISVNDRKVNIPSCQVNVDDIVTVVDHMKDNIYIQKAIERIKSYGTKPWLEVDIDKLSGKVLQLPDRVDIDLETEENLIVEFYNR